MSKWNVFFCGKLSFTKMCRKIPKQKKTIFFFIIVKNFLFFQKYLSTVHHVMIKKWNFFSLLFSLPYNNIDDDDDDINQYFANIQTLYVLHEYKIIKFQMSCDFDVCVCRNNVFYFCISKCSWRYAKKK